MPKLPFQVAALGLWLAAVSACVGGPTKGHAPQAGPEVAVPEPEGIRAAAWIEGLRTPWSLVFLPDGRALVSEREGAIRVIGDSGGAEVVPVATLEAAEGTPDKVIDTALSLFRTGEGGLMGLAVHPDFPDPPLVYAMHTRRRDDGDGDENRVVRLREEGGVLIKERVVIDGIPASWLHNGGRIGFGPDGMLYVATGDARHPELAQDLGSLAGKILRIKPDGAVPADNPFPGSPVYSYGHRNVQGLAWHPETGDLFVSEHGPSGEYLLQAYDEINVIVPGGNYGWPHVVGAAGIPEYIDPIAAWPETAMPPAGAAFHDGALFVATLKSETLLRVGVAQTEGGDGYSVGRIEHWFAARSGDGRFGRLRDAVAGPDGMLYVLTSNHDGRGDPRPGDDRILRLEPTP